MKISYSSETTEKENIQKHKENLKTRKQKIAPKGGVEKGWELIPTEESKTAIKLKLASKQSWQNYHKHHSS